MSTDAPNRSAVTMTALQRAYTVGRRNDLPLGGVECLAYLEFRGRDFDATRLQHAVERVHRHPALRCRFVLAQEALIEDGYAAAPVVIVRDVQPDPRRGRDEIRDELMRETIDIGRGLNWGVALTTADDCVLHLVFSLAAIDVAALGVVLHELAETYSATATAQSEPPLTVSALRDELHARSRPRRARRPRDGAPALLPGPELTGLREVATDDATMTTLRHELAQRQWDGILDRARDLGVSPAALVLAVYEGALRRWSGTEDFCVTVAALDVRSTSHLVTDRTVAYAHRARRAASFDEEVQLVAEDLRRRLGEHRDVMTEMREAQSAGAPVAASRCVFTYAAEMVVFTPLVLEVLGRPRSWGQTPQSAIDCRLVRLDEATVEVTFDVRVAAIPLHIAEAIFELFIQNLGEVVDTGQPRAKLPRSQAEVREHWNSTPPLTPRLIYDAFRRQAAERASAVAVEESRRYTHAESDGDSQLSYAELDRRALAFGGRIARLVPPGSLVAVQLPRGIDQIVAIVGVLYAGCAYLPIGLEAPPARLERIRERSQWSLLITPDFREHQDAPPLKEPIAVSADDLAYVIFTSGSTGEPKGVAIAHASAANTITDVNTRNGVGSDDALLAVSGIDFDLSVYDIFGALGAGARLIVVGEAETRDPFCWGEVIRRAHVTIWNSVPMLLEMLTAANESLPSLRSFLISGDWIPLDLPARSRAMSPGSSFVAMGGATEASIWSNEYVVADSNDLDGNWASVPYGRPLTGQKYRVVDARGGDRPDECVGELVIGGVGVAQGYYRDAERTEAAFVIGPDGKPWYHTGDLGMWRSGLLVFAGRQDTQVKIRGHRVECGEVEARLCEHPGVVSAAVVPVRDRSALGALYVPTDADLPPQSPELSAHLAAQLPWYMVPAAWRATDALPMTANGKVDRGMVADLVEREHGEPARAALTDGPVQSAVAQAWAQTLGRVVDADSNFFALGGDSLAATHMCARLRESGLRADLANLFRAPVLATFADTCREPVAAGPAPGYGGEAKRRPSWRERAEAEGASLSSLGFVEWCRWVWRHELGMHDGTEDITDDADFFALGGDSLTGARVCADLRVSGLDATVATLFRYPRFEDFCRHCTPRPDTDDADRGAEACDGDDDTFDLTALQLAYALGADGIPGVVRTSPCVAVIVTSDDPAVSARWQRALNQVVARHEALRLVRRDDWRQGVVAAAEPEFARIPFPLTDEEFRDLLRRTTVDPLAAPAVRGFVRRDHPHELGLVFNYLALDSLSVATVLRDLAALALGRDDLDETTPGIAAFRRYATSRVGAPGEIPTQAPVAPRIPIVAIPEGPVVFESCVHVLDGATVTKLRDLARCHGVTVNSVLLRAYSAALASATRQSRITVNIPTANRPAESPDALGQFSDLALCECRDDMSLREIHEQLGTAIAQAGTVAFTASTQRQRYPVVFTSLLGSPLAGDLAGGVVRATWTHTRTPAVLIDCQVMPVAHGIELRWDYPRQVIPQDFLDEAFDDFIQRVLTAANEAVPTGHA